MTLHLFVIEIGRREAGTLEAAIERVVGFDCVLQQVGNELLPIFFRRCCLDDEHEPCWREPELLGEHPEGEHLHPIEVFELVDVLDQVESIIFAEGAVHDTHHPTCSTLTEVEDHLLVNEGLRGAFLGDLHRPHDVHLMAGAVVEAANAASNT